MKFYFHVRGKASSHGMVASSQAYSSDKITVATSTNNVVMVSFTFDEIMMGPAPM